MASIWVAPLTGSVDRNEAGVIVLTDGKMSLPSRGAWIEILPAESLRRVGGSLPSRGAWIEIPISMELLSRFERRSPHGERG